MNTTTTTTTSTTASSSPAIGPPPPPSPMSDPPPHTSQNDDKNNTTVASPPTAEVVNLRPPSKLPSRPRKLRKLSPEPTDSSNLNIITTTTTSNNEKIVPRRRIQNSLVQLPRSLSSEGEVEAAVKHLRSVDPCLSKLIDSHSLPKFDSFQPPFLALAKSILYQQLAYKAGSSIYSRFVALCGGESGVVPETILSMTSQQLRQIGVSGRKTEYLHDLSRKYQNGILSDTAIANMDDKSLFTMLTMVNGIGSWSVHMFMIFSLHRPDVLPANDLGIRKGVQNLYGLNELPRPSQMEQLCEKWRPYRSVACWYIWRFMEANNGSSTSVINVPASGIRLQQQQQQERQGSPHQQSQHQHQQQFVDPVNGIINLGQLS